MDSLWVSLYIIFWFSVGSLWVLLVFSAGIKLLEKTLLRRLPVVLAPYYAYVCVCVCVCVLGFFLLCVHCILPDPQPLSIFIIFVDIRSDHRVVLIALCYCVKFL